MMTHISSTVLYVGNQGVSLAFFRDTLGFEVVKDLEMGPGSRWLEVRPPGAQTSIVLSDAAAFGRTPGEGAELTFIADDVAATVKELRARGATVSDPTVEPWTTFATVEAPDGKRVLFKEAKDSPEARGIWEA
ncbi:VOC family protein [Streptomyces sp. NPDC093085]|uniref:VOC family protein n=1 Tax=Streptomyces sp. NPDC093085 TaxID=3155068 RepID=UPI00344409A1